MLIGAQYLVAPKAHFRRVELCQNFFHNFPVTTTGFAEIAILKALELGKIEVGRDF